MLEKRSLWATVLFAVTVTAWAVADDTPGVTASEIKIGNTNAYSGPASAYSVIAKLESAFFKMLNDQGGVAGHKINFISLDDGYSPPKTVEQVRRLVEEDQVALLFNTLGTPTNSAIQRCVNERKVPHLRSYRQARIILATINTSLGRCVSSPAFGSNRRSTPNTF